MAAEITLRVRSPLGMQRIQAPLTMTLAGLRDKIMAATGIPPSSQVLGVDAAMESLLTSSSLTIREMKLENGSMLYLKDGRLETGGAASKTCTHPPQFTCLNCSGRGTESAEIRCNHGTNTTCPNCMSSGNKGNMKWLCKHGPNAKCTNCMKVRKRKKAKKKTTCSHPKSMRCPACIDATPSPAGGEDFPSPRCNHPPHMKCNNCLVDEEDEGPWNKKRACRNHGSHGSCVDCLGFQNSSMPIMKAQVERRCPGVNFDSKAIHMFQQYLVQTKFQAHRVGWLYGSVNVDNSINVDAIYEPPQTGSQESFELLVDHDAEKVESIASMLGLKKVGWIFSHEQTKLRVTSEEVLKMAMYQNQYDPTFATVVVTPTDDGCNIEAFHASDAAMKMMRQGRFLAGSDDIEHVKMDGPVLLEGKEANEVPVSFFLLTTAIRGDHEGNLARDFPVENRMAPQIQGDLKVHMNEFKQLPYVDRIADFHLLLFLTNFLDLQTDMPALCDAVRTRNMAACEGFQIIINEIAGV